MGAWAGALKIPCGEKATGQQNKCEKYYLKSPAGMPMGKGATEVHCPRVGPSQGLFFWP